MFLKYIFFETKETRIEAILRMCVQYFEILFLNKELKYYSQIAIEIKDRKLLIFLENRNLLSNLQIKDSVFPIKVLEIVINRP